MLLRMENIHLTKLRGSPWVTAGIPAQAAWRNLILQHRTVYLTDPSLRRRVLRRFLCPMPISSA